MSRRTMNEWQSCGHAECIIIQNSTLCVDKNLITGGPCLGLPPNPEPHSEIQTYPTFLPLLFHGSRTPIGNVFFAKSGCACLSLSPINLPLVLLPLQLPLP
jgi:hypothetical protein